MKNFRFILTIFAFAFAIGGAAASSDFVSLTNVAFTVAGAGPFPTVTVDVCDKDLITGIQCQVSVGPTVKFAYIGSKPLFRP